MQGIPWSIGITLPEYERKQVREKERESLPSHCCCKAGNTETEAKQKHAQIKEGGRGTK